MKQLTLVFLLICTQLVLAQNQYDVKPLGPKRVQYQVGVSATNFLKEFIVPNNVTSTNKNPYDFNAKALFTQDGQNLFGVRFGAGYISNRNAQFNVLSNSESSTEDNSINFRLGFEGQKTLSNKWTVYYGLDYVYGNTTSTTVSSFNNGSMIVKETTKERKHTTGLGPVLGIQFRLNKHICLGTELTLYFNQFDGGTVTTTNNPSTSPILSEINNNGRNSNIIVPTFINLNIIL